METFRRKLYDYVAYTFGHHRRNDIHRMDRSGVTIIQKRVLQHHRCTRAKVADAKRKRKLYVGQLRSKNALDEQGDNLTRWYHWHDLTGNTRTTAMKLYPAVRTRRVDGDF